MLSQLTTEGPARPLALSTGTSVESPRMVVVIGAIVTAVMCGRTSSRVRTSTGRALSSRAMWIGRIRQVQTAVRAHARQDRQARDPGPFGRGSRRRVQRSRDGAHARAHGSRPLLGWARHRHRRVHPRTRQAHLRGEQRSACSSHNGTSLVGLGAAPWAPALRRSAAATAPEETVSKRESGAVHSVQQRVAYICHTGEDFIVRIRALVEPTERSVTTKRDVIAITATTTHAPNSGGRLWTTQFRRSEE